ncbi:dynein regulatory complex subunit 2 isoform X1 [Trachinotus anak]|uniref:dynein regulatory complex subunit 2 isoform X1 n=1 Tax=Trachinotus anak TaxID=443729 RepID=UPI0039F1B3BE
MPKKAKKGGGGKSGGRSEFLQQRAQAEEEMAKKREETLTQFLKDKLEKEEKNTAENLRKLNESWRAILRQTRDPELRQEITIFSRTFERQLEGLDSVIKDLACDLQEKERRSAQERRVHLQRLEQLCALHEKRMVFVQQHWESSMQQLSSRFKSEGKQMLAHSQQQRADVEDAALTVEQQHREVMEEILRLYGDAIAAYQSTVEERVSHRTSSPTSLSQIRDRSPDQVSDICLLSLPPTVQDGKETLKETLKEKETLGEERLEIQEALQFCHNKKERVGNLVVREQLYFQILAEKMKEVKGLQDSVFQLRVKLNSSQTENQAEEKELMASSNEVDKKTDQLRQRLDQGRSAARKQLIHLTVHSSNATKKLHAVIAKGERVLRVAEMCRKLERKHEKLLTSSSSSPAENHRSVTEEEEPAKESSEFPQLQQLTQRFSLALLVRLALRKQMEDLSRQNQQLRLQLRQQVDDMSVGNHALHARHAPITISQAPTTTVPTGTSRRRHITKAIQVVKHSASPKTS